jgi:ActR/RegA family two-component response regulator
MSNEIKPTCPRVLIVDNEEDIVELYRELVTFWGYSPIVAEGIGSALLEDAGKKARAFRCQMALVDMRLVDNFDDDDMSGLNLIKAIEPAKTIIVSGYGTTDLAVDIVKNSGAADFFEKSDDPDKLKSKMDKLAGEICAVRRATVVESPEILNLVARTLFDPIKDLPAEAHDQALDVLVRLFPNAKKLRLEKTNPAIVSSDFSTVPRPRSVVALAHEDELQPVIVKIARAEKIKKEVGNFEEYIKGRLVGKHNTIFIEHVELWDIGGVRLSYVDALEGSFSSFVVSQPIEQIRESLEKFFLKTWSAHYQRASDVPNVSLFQLYCQVWDRDWVDRASKASMPDASDIMPDHLWKLAERQTPLEWFKTIVDNEGSERDPSRVAETKIAVTHGDLHADNLLMDDTRYCWVVDFERTRRGHVLQDFIELESDIITRIACARDVFPSFYHFCVTVAGARAIDEPVPATPPFDDDETRKLLEVIEVIRRLAVQCTGITDFRQYLLGLYFNTIFRATIKSQEHKSSREMKELRAWMLASILSHRLAAWNEPWPPEQWNRVP